MTSTYYPGWEIVQEIGSGSFGTVYEIKKTQSYGFTENSALKVIRIPASASEIKEYENEGYDEQSITAMFKDQMEEITAEFGLMSKLKGTSNIVSYEDHSVIPHEDGIGWDIYIRMELLTSLPDYIKERKTVDEETVLRIGRDICKALMLCEKHGIIHRDIKPSNIFLNRNDDFKLGDFGIAKMSDHTTRGAKTGTYAYMAPEVFNNKPYGFRADIYSLGMVLYWLLNERRGPFLPLPPEGLRANMHSVALTRRMDGEALPAPAHGSEALKAVVQKACAFEPNDRYRSASEMLKALNGILVDCEQETIPNLVVEDVPAPVSEREEVVIVDETVGPFGEVAPVVTEDTVIEGTVGPFDVITNEVLNEGTIGPFDDIPPDNLNGETDEFTPTPKPEPKPKKRKWAVFVAVAAVIVVLVGIGAFIFGDSNNKTEYEDIKSDITQDTVVNHQSSVLVYENLTYEIGKDYEFYYNEETEECEYLPDGSIVITGYVNEPKGELIIPKMIDGRAVTGVESDSFVDCYEITSVSLPEGLLYIGSSFNGCIGLESINIPESVLVISGGFSNCTSLKSIVVPNDNTIMQGNFAFEGCTSLEYASVPNPGGYMFAECTALREAVLRGNKGDISHITHFAGCVSLEKVVLPISVEWILTDGFSWCDNLKEVHYNGSEKQWKAIKTGSGYEEMGQTPIKQFENAKIYYNSYG